MKLSEDVHIFNVHNFKTSFSQDVVFQRLKKIFKIASLKCYETFRNVLYI